MTRHPATVDRLQELDGIAEAAVEEAEVEQVAAPAHPHRRDVVGVHPPAAQPGQ